MPALRSCALADISGLGCRGEFTSSNRGGSQCPTSANIRRVGDLMTRAMLGLWVAISLGGPAVAADWRPYANGRFGTVTEVPSAFLVQPPPANDDGREYHGPDDSILRVYGSYSGTGGMMSSFADYHRQLLRSARDEGVNITMDRSGPGWFALSGIKGDTIVYTKVVLGCGATHHVQFEYPVRDKLLFDAIVTHVAGRLGCDDPS